VREEYYAAVTAAGASEPNASGITSPTHPSLLPSTSSSLANFVLFGLPRLNHPSASERSESAQNGQTSATADSDDFKAVSTKPALIAAVQEVIDELETVYDNVAKNARDHIHSE